MAKGVIFVTGAGGHIGNHIVADLLAHGYSVKGSVKDLNNQTKLSMFMHMLENWVFG